MNPRDHDAGQDALDADERALAARLRRLGPQGEPAPSLDGRILAAARAAADGPSSGRASAVPPRPGRPRQRWPVALGIAASLVLAVGVAWRLRPLPERVPLRGEMDRAAPVQADGVAADARAGRAVPAPPKPVGVVPARPAASREKTNAGTGSNAPADATGAGRDAGDLRERRAMDAPAGGGASSARSDAAQAEAGLAGNRAPVQVQSATAEGRAAAARDAAASPQAFPSAPAAQPRTEQAAPAPATPARRMPPPPAPPPPPTPLAVPEPPPGAGSGTATEANRAAGRLSAGAAAKAAAPPDDAVDAEDHAAQDAFADAPAEDIPPATADSPAVRDAWLARIRMLLDAGRHDDALESLRAFRRRFPVHPLPADLRALERELEATRTTQAPPAP